MLITEWIVDLHLSLPGYWYDCPYDNGIIVINTVVHLVRGGTILVRSYFMQGGIASLDQITHLRLRDCVSRLREQRQVRDGSDPGQIGEHRE